MGQACSKKAAPRAPRAAAAPAPPQQPEDEQQAAFAYSGAPTPFNETERLSLLRALGVLDSEQGPSQFDAITKLLCAVFNVPIALVSLVDEERQWFKSVQGLGNCVQTGRDESFCAWTLLPESPYVLIVEDAREDKRFANNPLVIGPPSIRFYAGAPLISSANSYRYGTLCVIDTKPHREFAAEQYNMLIQFAELCVREIEKDKLTTLQKLVQTSGMGRSEASLSPLGSVRTSPDPSVTVTPSPSTAAVEPASNGTGWRLTRAADCFREGVLLVNVGTPSWHVLYTNEAFTAASGIQREEATRQGFWELFSAQDAGPASFQEAVSGNEPFSTSVALQPTYSRMPRTLVVDFRPAATGQVGGHSQLVGIPATAPSMSDSERPSGPLTGPTHFYFGILRADSAPRDAPSMANSLPTIRLEVPAAASQPATFPFAYATSQFGSGSMSPGQQRGSAASTAGGAPGRASMDSNRSGHGLPFKRAMPSAFIDVRLGPLIGRGAYGRVYRGSWNGNTVAVKVLETTEALESLDEESEGLPPGKSGIFEAVLSSNLSHPNIVHTYQYAFRPVTPDDSEDRTSSESKSSDLSKSRSAVAKPATEVWLVSEFCNRGPLLTAIERGAFLTQPSSQYGQPNLIAVLQTLQEIAAALQYLHRSDVLHGDLTGGNVLLTASDKDSRGFTAKVVDFGLSRVCSGDYLRTRTLGCAEYMPPELITEGILTKAADVYAFGVITWEIYVGRRAWDGLKPTEVLRKVASNTKLGFPPQTPHRLKVLGDRCMEYAPAARPTMEEVLAEVNSILSDTMGILQQFLAASSSAGAGGEGGGHAAPAMLQPSDPFQ
ncbi:kinase [Micractinium conductrix]|uniref:Kinase n=1 Tax=Micractinium conductrix TaxID=554055 RepID=A0A2P6V923_9CHLO|nr:kinase [Micractinium conductrix]|eukprot:PSC70592.1 kinase [Micractinium conductrix]